MRGANAGQWELNQINAYTPGIITLQKVAQNTYVTDSGNNRAQVIQLKQWRGYTQNSPDVLTAKPWDGSVGGVLAILCKGAITNNGTINLAGSNGGAWGSAHGGATGGGFWGGSSVFGSAYGCCGEGTQGPRDTTGYSSGGSGGGTSYGSSGSCGGGGNKTAGGEGQSSYHGYGGIASSNPGLTVMTMGGGGGGNSRNDQTFGTGASGGAIAIFICENFVNNSTIIANGGVGGNGYEWCDGGSGAGGSILIKAKTATLGSGIITASGGATGGTGGAGGDGAVHLDYSQSYTGNTAPTLDARLDQTIHGKFGGGALLGA